LATSIEVKHPTEQELYQFKEMLGEQKNMSEDHPINSTRDVKEQSSTKKVTCYCFSQNKILSGYSDGLVCIWDEYQENKYQATPFIGHTNRVNHIMHIPDSQYMFTVSNDCTMRQWALHTTLCERLYKFADPIYYVHYYPEKNLLFTSCWDR